LAGTDKLRVLRNAWATVPAIIFANGPSVNQVSPFFAPGGILAASGAITIAVNRPAIPKPIYWYFTDDKIRENHLKLFRKPGKIQIITGNGVRELSPGAIRLRVQSKPFFSTNLLKSVSVCGTSTYAAIQIAYWFGCAPIYVCGLDMTFTTSSYFNGEDISGQRLTNRIKHFAKENETFLRFVKEYKKIAANVILVNEIFNWRFKEYFENISVDMFYADVKGYL